MPGWAFVLAGVLTVVLEPLPSYRTDPFWTTDEQQRIGALLVVTGLALLTAGILVGSLTRRVTRWRRARLREARRRRRRG
jgi:hypothetical protein